MLEGSWKYLREPIFVVFRNIRHANVIKIEIVLLVKRTTSHAQCQYGAADFRWCNLQDVQISRWPRKAVHHGDDEPSHTIQPNILARRRIQFAQEREPWFRNTFIRMRRQGLLPSCR